MEVTSVRVRTEETQRSPSGVQGALTPGRFGPGASPVGRLQVGPGEQRDPVARPWACGAGASSHPAQQTSTTGVRPGASVPNTRRSQGSTTTSPEEASGGTNVSGGTECAPSGPAGPVTPSLGRSGCARAPPRAGRGAGVLSLPSLSRRCGHGAAQSANYIVFKIHFTE